MAETRDAFTGSNLMSASSCSEFSAFLPYGVWKVSIFGCGIPGVVAAPGTVDDCVMVGSGSSLKGRSSSFSVKASSVTISATAILGPLPARSGNSRILGSLSSITLIRRVLSSFS